MNIYISTDRTVAIATINGLSYGSSCGGPISAEMETFLKSPEANMTIRLMWISLQNPNFSHPILMLGGVPWKPAAGKTFVEA